MLENLISFHIKNEIREYFMDSGSEEDSESEFDSQPCPSGMNRPNLQILDSSNLQESGTDSDNPIVDDVDLEDSESGEEVFLGPQNLCDWVDAKYTSKFETYLFDFDEKNSGIDHNLVQIVLKVIASKCYLTAIWYLTLLKKPIDIVRNIKIIQF